MTRQPAASLVLAAALTLYVAACDSVRPPPGGTAAAGAGGAPAQLAACTGCHGDPVAGNSAPPRSIRGGTATTDLAVGAHQRHLQGGAVRRAVDCGECHLVPATPDAPGHIDADHADVTFGALGSASGVAPSWDRTAATCTTYCHGASLGGGSVTRPVWTKVDGTQAACGTCHGLPPPPPHPAVGGGVTACAGCHPGTVRSDGSIDLDGALHVNGQVEVAGGGGGCTACHGDASRGGVLAAAPPRDAHGSTSSDAVGAHQAHLRPGALSSAIACSECHRVPTDTAHASQPLDLTWGTLARSGGVTPAWSPATLACANYCHGASLAGGTRTSPVWTNGASEVACGGCHGISPATGQHRRSQHVSAGCGACHGTGYSATTVRAGSHVNGTTEVGGAGSRIDSYGGGTCSPSCHGPELW